MRRIRRRNRRLLRLATALLSQTGGACETKRPEPLESKDPYHSRPGEVRRQHPRANKHPAANTPCTEQGGYALPDLLSWSPVALPGLPSGRERHRNCKTGSLPVLPSLASTARRPAVYCTPTAISLCEDLPTSPRPMFAPSSAIRHRVVVPKVAGSSPVGHPS